MRLVDLFCGCGGLSLGFQNAGYDIVAAYDSWEPVIQIYSKNFQHPVFQMDLNANTSLDHIAARNPEIIIGGPPCQDFSIAGYRSWGERANLTIRFAEIISAIRPKWFVMENVYNIERMPVLPRAVDIVRTAGYGISKHILDASYCGVPQARKRFFMIGHLADSDGFLDKGIEQALSAKPTTVYDYLGNTLDTEFYYMHPRSYNRRAVFSVHEPSATIRGVNRPIPSNYRRHHADKADISDGVRSLTTRERSLIQTFPETFIWEGNKTAVEQAIGNAVPVKLAEFVADRILEYSNR